AAASVVSVAALLAALLVGVPALTTSNPATAAGDVPACVAANPAVQSALAVKTTATTNLATAKVKQAKAKKALATAK
ncbi:hypothetical protein, partial [Salmonella enterica]|uniref:hypothetical protein n=1 Tax=Salmonella enterica TaxID=28901 RepID=UPI0015C7B300